MSRCIMQLLIEMQQKDVWRIPFGNHKHQHHHHPILPSSYEGALS